MKTVLPMRALVFCSWPRWAILTAILAGLGLRAFGQTPVFAPVVLYDAGTNSGPSYIVAADVNGDGKPDLLSANYYSSTVGVYLGTGTGSFGGMTLYSTGAGSFPIGLAVADVNGDSKPDILTANLVTNTVGVLLGTGMGGFGTVTAYSAGIGNSPNSLAVADVNGDSYLDVLTANKSSTVGVLLGTGTGGFGAVTTYSTGVQNGPISLAVTDVNGDGRPDVLTANSLGNTVGVLLGTGAGSFGAVTTYSAGPNSIPFGIVVADVNGDNKPDLLTANSGSSTAGVLLGTGTGTFGAVTTYSTGASTQPLGIATADVNSDGKLDLLIASDSNTTADVLLGTGTGSFGTVVTYSAGPASYPHGIAAADVNGDGKPDILTANSGNNTLGVLLNTTVLATRPVLPGASASLAPNPAHLSATLATTGLPATARYLEATLYTALGQVVRRLVLPATAGAAQAEVPTANLPGGMYLLRLRALDVQGAAVGALPTQRLQVE